VGLLGAGVIGAGWAARFLLHGVEVRVFDPDPRAEDHVHAAVENARRAYGALMTAPLPDPGTFTIASTPEDAARGADFVQESVPEREELKRGLLAAAGSATAADVVIASSTSGLLPSRLQDGVPHPERVVVGHPFHPVYLLPLVEVCGGAGTSPDAVAQAEAVYRAVGMAPLRVRKEIDGFVADRLLEALWREALWLVADDIATVEEVDDAISLGAGLRAACMGPFLTYRIAGGAAGMRHFLEHFGPALELPWSKLTDVPRLTDGLVDKVVAQSDAQAAGRDHQELERLRDDCLVALIQGLRAQGAGAGAVLAEYERSLFHAPAPEVEDTAPLRLHETVVAPEWIDYNGHAHESTYLRVFGDTTDALLRHIGLDPGAGSSYFTVETHISHIGQARVDERLHTTTQLLGHDAKRLHLFHALYRTSDGELLATGEHMLLHVDTDAQRTSAAEPALLERLDRIARAHAGLPRPERAGRAIALPPGGRPTR
jgi:carnitine 3-dehydrogenase / betainyl-CoA thioesterase